LKLEGRILDSSIIDSIRPWANWWAQLKLELGSVSGLSPDALHIQVGILVLCVVALVLRRSPISFWPWLALLILECGNELADLMLDGMGSPEATIGAGVHDLLGTMIGPTALLLIGIWQRRSASGLGRARQSV
jgi:hypothetical protein